MGVTVTTLNYAYYSLFTGALWLNVDATFTTTGAGAPEVEFTLPEQAVGLVAPSLIPAWVLDTGGWQAGFGVVTTGKDKIRVRNHTRAKWGVAGGRRILLNGLVHLE